jgi:hypothetical protein
MAAGKKIVKGLFGALPDDPGPVDQSRRQFVKKAAVATPAVAVGAGALSKLPVKEIAEEVAGEVAPAIKTGKKSLADLFASGRLDDTISKIRSAFDEDWVDVAESGEANPLDVLKRNLGYDEDQIAKISEESGIMEYGMLEDLEDMNNAEIAESMRDLLDSFMQDYAYDFRKGRGENPTVLIDEFKKPAFKNEIMEKFPGVDAGEVESLANRLFPHKNDPN